MIKKLLGLWNTQLINSTSIRLLLGPSDQKGDLEHNIFDDRRKYFIKAWSIFKIELSEEKISNNNFNLTKLDKKTDLHA